MRLAKHSMPAVALLFGVTTALAQSGNGPVISKITFTFNSGASSPSAMDIYGTVKPTVTIDGLTPLVTAFTDQRATVSLSQVLAQGTHLVTLTPNSKASAGDDSKRPRRSMRPSAVRCRLPVRRARPALS